MAAISFVTTAWGPRHGGINAFNTDLCKAVAALRSDLRVVCFVLQATPEEIAEAESHGVDLVPMDGAPEAFTSAHVFELAAKADLWADLEWWVGHDVHSGDAVVEVAKRTSTRAAVIWHTDHISYATHKGAPGAEVIARNRRDGEILRQAAVVFGVGPTLAEAAADRLGDASRVITLLPGLASITPREVSPPTFRPITFGRLGPADDVIKRGTLAVLAFAQLVNEAPDIAGRDPRITLIGVDEREAEEERFRELAEARAGRKLLVIGHPFTEDREELFRVLSDASVCLMLSLHEGFGLVGWEAIAAGVPLVITRNSGLHRLLETHEDAAGLGRVLTVDVKGSALAIEDDIAEVTARLRQIALRPDIAKARALALRQQFSECTWEETARAFLEGLSYDSVGSRIATSALTLPETNLPFRSDQFFEWPDIVSACESALVATRLVTLVGPPGVGKTRLAVELAKTMLEEYDHHIYYVDLSRVADPELVVSRITHALRIEVGEPVTDALKEVFRGTRAIFLLDSFDRVLAAADAVQALLDEVPGLTILATSREPIGVRSERVIDVPLLRPDLAAKLFVARVPERSLAPSLDDPLLLRLCVRLDGLPLALELVAPRAQLYSVSSLLAQVDERLLDLKARQRDVAEHHLTLRAAFESSYELLEDSERRLFAELSVFAGGCTIETAASVLRGTAPGALEDDLLSLLSKRLLRDDLRGSHRFAMPETLRAYARERLEATPEANEVRALHAAHFLAFAESETGNDLEIELENLAAALQYFARGGQTGEALRLAALLADFWWSRDVAEGWQRLSEVLGSPVPERHRRAEAEVRIWSGRLAIRLGKLDEAAEAFDRAMTLAEEEEDAELEARALSHRALVHMEHAEFDAARPLLERAFEMQRQGAADESLADTLDSLGVLATGIGDYDTARQRLSESLTLYRNEIGVAWVHNDLARLELAQDNLDSAEHHASGALAIGARRPDVAVVAWARNYLGFVASGRGELDGAREHHDESLKLALLLGDRRPQALALEGFAALAVESRDPQRALVLAGASERWRTRSRIPRTVAESAILEHRLVRARAALGGAGHTAYETGRAMSLDEAVTVARGA